MASKVVGSELYSEIAEIINNNLTDLGISVNEKNTKGKNIYLQCEDDRLETQDHLESLIDNLPGVTSERITGTKKSSIDFTRIKRGSTEVDIVYKGGAKGGMNVTTLNASITELFPAVAFELGLPKTVSKDNFWKKIYSEGVKLKTGGVYKNDTALKAGKEEILTAKEKSDMFEAKLENGYDLFKYIMSNYDRKKIDKIVWGYRNNTKPAGVQPNHKGDIFVVGEQWGKVRALFNDKKGNLKRGSFSAVNPSFSRLLIVKLESHLNLLPIIVILRWSWSNSRPIDLYG